MKTITLPKSTEEFTDKYFLRTKEILEKENLNPYVRAQVFVRKGPGTTAGLEEAVEILSNFSDLEENGGRVYALPDGTHYDSKETLMVIEARIQDIVALETVYLGVISSAMTTENDGRVLDFDQIEANARAVVEAADGRPVSYFGARHEHWSVDEQIAAAAFRGGFTSSSTDAASAQIGQKGVGTIPHALENIMAWKHGYENAVVEATKAFDRHMPEDVPRIALIDYANREVEDAIDTADALEGRLWGVRVDTCGENLAQLAKPGDRKYHEGNGVTTSGVYALRTCLDLAGHEDVKIVLSSGFGKPEKVAAFVEAEKAYGTKLFDALGVGGIYEARMATMDIVAVGDSLETLQPMAKVGRSYQPNDRLELVLGGSK